MKLFAKSLFSVAVGALVFLSNGCDKIDDKKNQNSSEEDSTLNVISIDTTDIPYEIELKREVVFESNKEKTIDGFIGQYKVDSKDRVYILSARPNVNRIYIFAPDGSFLDEIGGYGRGPGDFESIRDVIVQDELLYIYDAVLYRISVFSINNFNLLETISLRNEGMNKIDELIGFKEKRMISVNEDGLILMGFSKPRSLTSGDTSRVTKYYYRNKAGELLPDKIIEIKEPYYFTSNREPGPGFTMPFTMPFSRSALIVTDTIGNIITAWTDEFLITVHDKVGESQTSLHVPVKKVDFSFSDITVSDSRKKLIEGEFVPEYWPELNDMVIDNKGRLWISTITSSNTEFRWIVLDEAQEVKATFTLPGRKDERNVITVSPIIVNNEYFYVHEFEYETATDRIVKYKIEFVER